MKNWNTDTTTAMTMPSRTPTSATPTNVTARDRELAAPHDPEAPQAGHVEQADARDDDDRGEHGHRQVGDEPGHEHEHREHEARPPRRRSAASCAPACSATAVRELLVLTGKPLKRPAATFAAPMPMISWLSSTSTPCRAANPDETLIVSPTATSVMPIGAADQERQVAQLDHREGRDREPLREHADDVDALSGQPEDRRERPS